MAPNGDMPDRRTQHESFTLANMVPQDADNNRHVWAGIENAVRSMVKKEGDLYVITGPAFLGNDLRKVGPGFDLATACGDAISSSRMSSGGSANTV